MTGLSIGVLLLSGTVLFVVSIALRIKSDGKYEVKMIDLTLVLIPLMLWLIGTGKVQKFGLGGLEFETAQAFLGASAEPIESQISASMPAPDLEDVIEILEQDTKAGVEQIPAMIRNRTQALTFRLGHGRYWGPAIQQYLESLGAYSFLRYVVIQEEDGRLFGVCGNAPLQSYFRQQGEPAYEEFAMLLNRPGDEAREKLANLPGFIPAELAVGAETNKRSVLELMEELQREVLPVVSPEGHFVGVVDRAELTASLIVDVARKLEDDGGE